MKKKHAVIAALLVIFCWGCSTKPERQHALVKGKITVADSVDASHDYSGIGLTVIKKDSSNAKPDTLFNAMTDTTGVFSGTATFDDRGEYPLIISRNDKNLGRVGILLADKDTVNIQGELPALDKTISISSREHAGMEVYQRVNRSFQRIAQYARAGKLKGDSLRQEVKKMSDLFWEVYQEKTGTIASELGARRSVQLLKGLDDKKMMEHIRSVQGKDRLSDLGATYGKDYIASSEGLAPAIAYLDSLSSITEDPNKKMQIAKEHIKLLYDSARVQSAKQQLKTFKKQFSDNKAAQKWIKSISYDLNYLSPGDSIPDFEFTENGKTISRDSLLGTPYILEITKLSNSLYQNQFDRTVVIHSLYKSYGLQVITIPLDKSQVTVNAFFDERVKPWPVADADAFDRQKLLDRFNVRLIPTRFLVDRNGKIVRKYVGQEYQDVIKGIQTIIKQDKKPAS
ncbi:MAG TPA: TlpA disulfide reductase family protein [Balneolaceae bacterium]|nr:TlpA disulfide reductase family protein [Balneolaceae bacterium]